MDRDKEKDRLAMIMTYGPEAGEALATHYVQLSPKVANEREAESNEFEDLIDEIGEREEFLQRMEKVGLSKEHRERIEQEVVEILVKLNQTDPIRYRTLLEHSDGSVGTYRMANNIY